MPVCSTMRSSSSWCPAPSTCQVRSRDTRCPRCHRRRASPPAGRLEGSRTRRARDSNARLSRRSRRSLGLFQTRRDRARNARGRRAACPNTRSAPSAREPALIMPRAPNSAPHSFPTERIPDRSAPSAVIATARPKPVVCRFRSATSRRSLRHCSRKPPGTGEKKAFDHHVVLQESDDLLRTLFFSIVKETTGTDFTSRWSP